MRARVCPYGGATACGCPSGKARSGGKPFEGGQIANEAPDEDALSEFRAFAERFAAP